MANKYMKDSDWANFKNFKKTEFQCKCGKKYCNGYPHEIAYSLVEVMQRLRDRYGKSVKITSGLRCKTHNKNVGGTANSKHPLGQAADFSFSGMNKNEVIAWLKKQPEYSYAYTNESNMKYAVHITTKLTSEEIAKTVERDTTKDQIKVIASELRVRSGAGTNQGIIGTAKKGGIYNYSEVKENGGYKWYKIADSQYVADNGKYLEVYQKEEPMSEIDMLKEELENKDLIISDFKAKYEELNKKYTELLEDKEKGKSSVIFEYKCIKSMKYKIKLNKGEILHVKKVV